MIEPIFGEECLQHINKPVMIGGNYMKSVSTIQKFGCYYVPSQTVAVGSIDRGYELEQFDHTGRLIGFLTGVEDVNGNPQIAILGNGTIKYNKKYVENGWSLSVRCGIVDGKVDGSSGSSITFNTIPPIGTEGGFMNSLVYEYQLPDVELQWKEATSNYEAQALSQFGKYAGSSISGTTFHEFNLSTDSTNTLNICVPIVGTGQDDRWVVTAMAYDDISFYNGNLAEFGYTMVGSSIGAMNQKETSEFPFDVWCYELPQGALYSYQSKPFNLLLTQDLNSAIAYVNNGTLPSDVFLYPIDEENLPTYTETPADEGGDDPDESGDTPDDVDSTLLVVPSFTPASLQDNNLYWLQGGELKSFMQWFWTDAGDIADLEDLWQKIQGLYNDLGAAIINVRYMPVNVSWIGGSTTAPGIVVGQIIKSGNVEKLNKAVAPVQDIGTIHIGEKFHSFADYSPYCECLLYLPYHGFVTLDIDMLLKHDLNVKAVYDHLSGTIQYYVFRDNTLINSCIAKMAVDLPITLQSKADLDNAIFQNVAGGVATLLGAGASIANKSPIGLVMATQNTLTGGAQSAPFKIMGTVGESGAYYAPNKCAVYISRPRYNRPLLYDSRVGFPMNKNYQLGKLSGLTICYNPYISFRGNQNPDNVKQYPLAEEIDMIYDYLKEGVIL